MNNNSTTGGVSIVGLLGLIFIVLKLCKVISWSWLWVLSPFWIPLAIIAIVFILGGIVAGAIYLFAKDKRL